MFNKKILLRFYLIGLPIIAIWGYYVTHNEPEYVPGETKIWDQAMYEESTSQMFWPIMGAGVILIGIAYVIFSVVYKMIKSKK